MPKQNDMERKITCRKKVYNWTVIGLAFLGINAQAQCPQFMDANGTPNPRPYWVSDCLGNDYDLNLGVDQNIGAYTIDWGDGSPVENGSSLNYGTYLTHTYPFNPPGDTTVVRMTITATGCVMEGVVVMEGVPVAVLDLPDGSPLQGCAPATWDFINASVVNISPTTTFYYDWGDGSPIEVYDWTNKGDTISHTYLPGTVDCDIAVTLRAENNCAFSTSTYYPLRVWEPDEAEITADFTTLCFPNATVHVDNTTKKNCNSNNTFQRLEYWNFGDHWGLGYDSIVPWQAWEPPVRPGYDITFPGTGSYTITLIDSSFCGTDSYSLTIDVVDPPTANLSGGPDSICEGESITFKNNSSADANVYWWNFGDGSGWKKVKNNKDQNHTYDDPGDYTVRVVAGVKGMSACTDTAEMQVHVSPAPIAAINLDNPIACDSATVTFTDASSADVVTWEWDFGNGNTSTQQHPPVQFYGASGNYPVSLRVTKANGCEDEVDDFVRIYETPTVGISSSPVCIGSETKFNDQSTSSNGDPITSWSWDFGDGGTSTKENPDHTYATADTFTVRLTVATDNCNATDSIEVMVHPSPVAGFNIDTLFGCTPLSITLSDASTGASSITWDFGDGNTSTTPNPSHVYTNTSGSNKTFTITQTVSSGAGCDDDETIDVTVYTATAASFTSNYAPSCSPLPVDLTNTSTGAVSFEWNFGDGSPISTEEHPTHDFVNNGLMMQNYTVTLTVYSANGCSDSTTGFVTVYPKADYSINMTPSDKGCHPYTVDFEGSMGGALYMWDFGDGSSLASMQNPTHTFTNTSTDGTDSTYTIQLVAMNAFSCMDTTMVNVTVHPAPQALIQPDVVGGCQPLSVGFTNQSVGASTYTWYFDDGAAPSNALEPSHTFSNTGFTPLSREVSLVATSANGCKDSASFEIEVQPQPVAAFVSDTIGCSPLAVTFDDESVGATRYDWSFGDGSGASILQNATHVFENAGGADSTYQVKLVATNDYGCADSAYGDITVHPLTVADFAPSTSEGCLPLKVDFENQSVNASSYRWDFGDGSAYSTASDPAHDYYNNSTTTANFDVELIATSTFGCSDTFVYPVVVYPQVIAAFISDSAACSPLHVNFDNQSTGAAFYKWDFGDGNISGMQDPAHVYVNTSSIELTRTVELVVTSAQGCRDTATTDITVYPQPLANFTASPIGQMYPNTTVHVIDKSSHGDWDYTWSWGDGDSTFTDTPGPHKYASWGTYIIHLTVTSDYCEDTISRMVKIIPPAPVPAMTFSDTSGCRSLTVHFEDHSDFATEYFWEFGDGGISTEKNPTYTYYDAGNYLATLTVSGPGGQKQISTPVTVHEVPNAYFTHNPARVFIPEQPVMCYNLSTYATDYLWDFGDGASSTEENPHHYYEDTGTYDISLIVTNEFGCVDTFIQPAAVVSELRSKMVFPNAFTPNPGGPNGGRYDKYSFNNDVFFPFTEGVDTYYLMIFNRWGELIFESRDVEIGWDGYYRQELSQQDVYVWKVFATFVDGSTQSLAGDVTLLR